MQWGGIKNGALLTLIERERFNVFLPGDKNMQNQQRLEDRPFAVLIMSAINWPEAPCSRDFCGVRCRAARHGEHDRLRRVRSTSQTHVERKRIISVP
jgi:hypothetical protein